MKKTFKRFFSIAILFFMIFSLSLTVPAVAYADNNSEKKEEEEKASEKKKKEEEKVKNEQIQAGIAEKQKEIDKAKKEKNELKNALTSVEKIKKQLEKSKADLTSYVTQLDANAQEIQDKILALTEQIEIKGVEIETTKKELEDAINVKDDQYERMTKRVQCMYEQGNGYYLEMLASSKGFSDFLNKLDYINQITSYDNKMFDEYTQTVEYVEACKEKLEAEEELLEETKNSAEEEKKALEELIAEKEKEINAYQLDINNKEAAIREYEAEIAEQNAVISQLEKAVEEAKKSLQGNRTYDGGMFKWPAPSYTRISDDYGWRTHPILGTQQFHSGVDMAAPGGSDILAAYDGTVVAAEYNASMGNYVMIDHGDGLYTVYMHSSKLLVSKGNEVTKGQKIALVGSTGRSTGNHLHFSVRLNGSYVSPWNYLSK